MPPVPSPVMARRPAQPPNEYAHRPEKRLIRIQEVCGRIGVCKSTLYRMVSLNSFPPPRKLGGRTVAWLEADVDAWIDSRSAV